MNDEEKTAATAPEAQASGNGADAPETAAPAAAAEPTNEKAAPAAAAAPSEADKAAAQIKELEDKLKYAAADKVNTVKRLEKEGAKAYQRGVEGVVLDLLPVQEDLERAYEAKADDVQSVKDGVAMILKEFKRVLEKYGIEEIAPTEGEPLDVNIHEALVQEEHPSFDENRVVRVIKRGYRHRADENNPRIIRAAQVVVSKKPAAAAAPADGGEDKSKEAAKQAST